MEKRVSLDELMRHLAFYFDIVIRPDEVWADVDVLLKELEVKDAECHLALLQGIESWSLYDYIKKDRELKIKMTDVWESELIRLRHEYHINHDKLVQYMRDKGISTDQSP